MVTAAQVAEFSSSNRTVVDLALTDLKRLWRSLNLSGDPTRVRDAVLEFLPDLVTVYGDVAAVIAADFYDDTRDAPGGYRAGVADPPGAEQTHAVARWGLGPLFQPEADTPQALTNLSGALQRLVLQAGRTTLVDSARRDPIRTGFARIPQGATCEWCVGLASRGFVYATEESAGAFNEWHDDCNCVIIAGRTVTDLPEGYDLGELRRLYAEDAGITA